MTTETIVVVLEELSRHCDLNPTPENRAINITLCALLGSIYGGNTQSLANHVLARSLGELTRLTSEVTKLCDQPSQN